MSLTRELFNKNIRRNNKYSNVVDILVYGASVDGSAGKIKVFNDIKDLIVFSAMVGKKFNVIEDVEKENTGIILQTFSGSGSSKGSRVDQHNILFMFALIEHRDMNYIRDEAIADVIELFEKYSNGGLSLIRTWLSESAWSPLCLLDKMVEVMNENGGNEAGISLKDNPFS